MSVDFLHVYIRLLYNVHTAERNQYTVADCMHTVDCNLRDLIAWLYMCILLYVYIVPPRVNIY
jgi:hypothetical protein